MEIGWKGQMKERRRGVFGMDFLKIRKIQVQMIPKEGKSRVDGNAAPESGVTTR